MPLPGKLCIGILEEDKPLRSYFRFKPLLVDEEGRYVPCGDAPHYPEEGCIRIVPDKNESYYFKARMRQIGLFCVVDLRQHPGENDKIRPNKNYRPGSEEINASIIYSDVVRAPADDMIFEILPAEAADRPLSAPHTPFALVREAEGLNPLRHAWEAIAGSDGMGRLAPTEDACPLAEMQVFDLPGFRDETVRFAIRPAGGLDRVSDMPERSAPATAARSAAAAPEVRPAAAARGQSDAGKPAAAAPVQSDAGKPAAAAPASADVDRPAAEAPGEPRPADDSRSKPWIHRDESMLPPPIDPRLSRAEQLRAAQAGLNPRRSRSLQELIDEKWQRSRLNQLGQPVSPICTGAPVQNPVDAAVDALRELWQQPRMREPLLESLSGLASFTQSLKGRLEATRQSAIAAELEALEAQKLELLSELDRLKANGDAIRKRLKQELRQEADAELDAAIRGAEDARAQLKAFEQQVSDARAAAQDAQLLLEQLAGDQLEQKIREVAFTRRVQQRIEALDGVDARVPPEAEAIDLEAMIARVTARFAAEGWALSRLEAANLSVCLAIGPVLMLTGAPGSGKSAAARLLADALGLSTADRVADIAPGTRPEARDRRVDALRRYPFAPAAIWLDDANLAPGADPLCGLPQAMPDGWRLIAGLQDAHSGAPVSAAAWDAGFAVRLTPRDSLPWRPAEKSPAPPVPLAALPALPQADVPEALAARVAALRAAMAERGAVVSRRALDDAWRYTAAMLAALGDDADPDAILDLAVAQRLLPSLLASAPIEAAVQLRALTADLPACRALLDAPLPMSI